MSNFRNPYSVECFVSTQCLDRNTRTLPTEHSTTCRISDLSSEKLKIDGVSSCVFITLTSASIDRLVQKNDDVRGVSFLMPHLTWEVEHHMWNARGVAEDMRLCFVLTICIPRLAHLPDGFSEYSSQVAVIQARFIDRGRIQMQPRRRRE